MAELPKTSPRSYAAAFAKLAACVTARDAQVASEQAKASEARFEGDTIRIGEPILFEVRSRVVRPESFDVLAAVAKVMKDRPEIERVEVRGHADRRGGAAENLNLTQQRAQAVVAYLTSAGVAATRLRAVGVGANCPLDASDDEAAYEKNRRVEFLVVRRGGKDARHELCEAAVRSGVKPAAWTSQSAVTDGASSPDRFVPSAASCVSAYLKASPFAVKPAGAYDLFETRSAHDAKDLERFLSYVPEREAKVCGATDDEERARELLSYADAQATLMGFDEPNGAAHVGRAQHVVDAASTALAASNSAFVKKSAWEILAPVLSWQGRHDEAIAMHESLGRIEPRLRQQVGRHALAHATALWRKYEATRDAALLKRAGEQVAVGLQGQLALSGADACVGWVDARLRVLAGRIAEAQGDRARAKTLYGLVSTCSCGLVERGVLDLVPPWAKE